MSAHVSWRNVGGGSPVGWGLACGAALLVFLAMPPAAHALTLTGVKIVNVSPSGFSVLWITSEPAQPAITVYADANGNSSLTGQVGVEVFPLGTGPLGAGNAYEQRQADRSLQAKTKALNLNLVRVTGCQPGTLYYFRARGTAADGSAAVFPVSAPLPSVRTAVANSFVAHARQLIVQLPSATPEGTLVTLGSAGAAYPLAAVAGDGVRPNQVYFNLADLFLANGSGNLSAPGDHVFGLEIVGAAPPNNSASYTLTFEEGFLVAEAELRGFAREDLIALKAGRTAVRRDEAGSVPIGFSSGARFDQIAFRLQLPPSQLANVMVESSIPAVAGVAWEQVAPGDLRVTVTAHAGSTLTATPEMARLRFSSTPGIHSAIAHLTFASMSFQAAGAANVTNRLLLDGRVFIIGQEPILDAALTEGGQRQVTLYGLPGVTYVAESTEAMSDPVTWQNPVQVTLEGLSRLLEGVPSEGNVFFRARRDN